MKYNRDYYIMCMHLPADKKSRYVKKVKGSYPIKIMMPVWDEYVDAPEMFIHKDDYGQFILSDSKTGICIYRAYQLKDIGAWLDDQDNIKAILEAYNRPFIVKEKQIFNDLVSQAA